MPTDPTPPGATYIRAYVRIEVNRGDPRIEDRFDVFLAPWMDAPQVLSGYLDGLQSGQAATLTFTLLEMTEAEHDTYCEEHGIETE